MKICIVIPARLKSSRLPEKLLRSDSGKPLIQHTYEAACRSKLADQVIIAADSKKIADVVENFGGKVVLTSPEHPSGTDRIAEVAQSNSDCEIFVNVQGDEPEIEPESIDLAIELLLADSDLNMATLARPIVDKSMIDDPACVKVVLDEANCAIYFSRAPIPFHRDESQAPSHNFSEQGFTQHGFLQHVGLYVYRRDFLLQLSQTAPTRLEQIEKLEQLRVLETGHKIGVALVQDAPSGIDTLEDYEAFVRRQTN